MKKILITGASGFIGSFLVETALAKTWDICAGIREGSSKQYLQDPKIDFIDLKFADKKMLQKQINEYVLAHGKWDYIIHNAGITKALNQSDFEQVNTQFCINFVDALIAADAVPSKFIFMSSLSAFGPGDESGTKPLLLSSTPKPNTNYGLSKLKAEQYIQSISNFPYMIIRPTGVYGPRDRDYLMVLKMIQKGLNVGLGFKTQYLTFIYVKDLAKACFLALESPLCQKAYFVTDGDMYTDKAYTRIAQRVMKQKRVLNCRIPLFVVAAAAQISEYMSAISKEAAVLNKDKYKILKQRNWCCETAPLENELKFAADYNLSKGMQESVEWYKENKWL